MYLPIQKCLFVGHFSFPKEKKTSLLFIIFILPILKSKSVLIRYLICSATCLKGVSVLHFTLGDLTLNFPTFSKPILNLDLYIKTDQGST